MRAKPLGYRDKKSQTQLENRARMKTIMAFLSKAKGFVNHNLDHLTKNESATNRVTKLNYNKIAFGERVIEGGRNGGKIVVDYLNSRPLYEELVLSEGELFGLDGAMMLMRAGRLELRWSNFECEGRSMSSDRVNVMVYNSTRHEEITGIDVASRMDESLSIEVPERWSEEELHVWVSVSDRWEGEFSESQYFGHGNGETELERGEELEDKMLGLEHSAIKVVYGCYQSAVEEGAGRGKEGDSGRGNDGESERWGGGELEWWRGGGAGEGDSGV